MEELVSRDSAVLSQAAMFPSSAAASMLHRCCLLVLVNPNMYCTALHMVYYFGVTVPN